MTPAAPPLMAPNIADSEITRTSASREPEAGSRKPAAGSWKLVPRV
jgi:hypothetical protein